MNYVASPTDIDVFFMGAYPSSSLRQCLPFDDLELTPKTFRPQFVATHYLQALSLFTIVFIYTRFLSSMSESVSSVYEVCAKPCGLNTVLLLEDIDYADAGRHTSMHADVHWRPYYHCEYDSCEEVDSSVKGCSIPCLFPA